MADRLPQGRPPQDKLLDRRHFLERMGLLTAAAATGSAFAPTQVLGLPASGVGVPTLPDPRSIQATEPWALSVAELAALIRDGALSPADLVDAYLARIEAMDGTLMAFNTVNAEAARAAAARLGRVPWTGPLHGIPLAIKDNYYTKGVRTTANSHIYADFVPEYDATAWARLQQGGAILLGKTQMGPLATTSATTPDGVRTTRNAWAPGDPTVDPGGSSSGSATSVAARMAASSTGTQTGGSITNPSSQQGLTGLKPTMGRVSLHGIVPLTYTRDHPGPLARDAKDAAIMLQHMAGPDPMDPRTQGLPPVPDFINAAEPVRRGDGVALRWPTTVGVLPDYLDPPEEEGGLGEVGGFRPRSETPEQRDRRVLLARERRATEQAARRAMVATFQDLGAEVVEVELPPDWDLLTGGNFNNVRLPERTEPFLDVLRRDVRLFGVSLSPWINGLLLSGPEYLRGQRAKMLLLQRVLDGLFARCDVVVQTSPIPFDIIGLPLIAFPIGFEDSKGVPLPVPGMLGGLPFGEERLLSLVAAYQAVTDWHRRRPADAPAAGEPGGGAGSRQRDGAHRLDALDVLESCQ